MGSFLPTRNSTRNGVTGLARSSLSRRSPPSLARADQRRAFSDRRRGAAAVLRRRATSSVDASGSTNRASSHQRRKNTAGPVPGGRRRTLSPPGSLTSEDDKRALLSAHEDAIGCSHCARAGKGQRATVRDAHSGSRAADTESEAASSGCRKKRRRSGGRHSRGSGDAVRARTKSSNEAASVGGPTRHARQRKKRDALSSPREGGNPQVRSPSERPLFFFFAPPKQPGPTQKPPRSSSRTGPALPSPPFRGPLNAPLARSPLHPKRRRCPCTQRGPTCWDHGRGGRRGCRPPPRGRSRPSPPTQFGQWAEEGHRNRSKVKVSCCHSAPAKEGKHKTSFAPRQPHLS